MEKSQILDPRNTGIIMFGILFILQLLVLLLLLTCSSIADVYVIPVALMIFTLILILNIFSNATRQTTS
jgi:hypothetical protein